MLTVDTLKHSGTVGLLIILFTDSGTAQGKNVTVFMYCDNNFTVIIHCKRRLSV